MSTLQEDTDCCAKHYRCALDIYLITVLSYLYDIIMDSEINSPVHRNIVVDGINATTFFYSKEQIELIGKFDTSKIGMLPSASKDISIKFSDQCIQIDKCVSDRF